MFMVLWNTFKPLFHVIISLEHLTTITPCLGSLVQEHYATGQEREEVNGTVWTETPSGYHRYGTRGKQTNSTNSTKIKSIFTVFGNSFFL